MGNNRSNLELTTQEKECLRLYRAHLEKFRTPPTRRWLSEQMKYRSHNAVTHLLSKLEEKGYLVTKPVTVMRLKLSAKGKRAAQ